MSKRKSKRQQAKKAAVLQEHKSKINPLTIAFGIMAVIISVAAAYYITVPAAPRNNAVSVAKADAAQVSYPISMFSDGTARHFELKSAGLTIRYFILKSSDGIVRAAFDACDVCWPSGKGYYQDGDDMVCRNCGRRFASVLVNEVKGGCNPAPLVRKVEGNQLILKVEDILQGKTYFDFKGKV